MGRTGIVVGVLVLAGAGAAQAQDSPARRAAVNKCQSVVRAEGRKLIDKYVNGFGTCLQKVSDQVVRVGSNSTVAKAEKPCAARMKRLSGNSSVAGDVLVGFVNKVKAACVKNSVFSLADVLGGVGAVAAKPLGVSNLDAYCAGFGGDGTISDIDEWIACLRAAHLFEARQAVAVQYARGKEWVELVESGVTTADANAGVALTAAKLAIWGSGTTPLLSTAACGADLVACEADLAICQAGIEAGLLVTGETTSYGPGSDGAEQRGATRSYTDNGNGTITDNRTGLMWEKKSDDGSIHDKDNVYAWGQTSAPFTMDGTMVTEFLAGLNTVPCFAGHCDWRIPNQFELYSLLDLGRDVPVIDPVFNTASSPGCTVTTCSCTQSSFYWSATTIRDFPGAAWGVAFDTGNVGSGLKSFSSYVRAVRSGS